MLFKRRKKLGLWQNAKKILWPASGWQRMLRYYKYRLLRQPVSDHSVAMGLAAGCAISWTPAFGTHVLQCFIFSRFVNANFFASIVGTFIGNPWTFPFMWWVSYQVGLFFFIIIGQDHMVDTNADLSFVTNFTETPFKILLPMLTGGYLLAIATFPVFYFPLYYSVKALRATHQKIMEKRRHK